MTIFKWLASVTLAATAIPVLQAEPLCPGNVASLRLRLVHGSQMIVPVSINHTGPYDFLLDTDTQVTMIDPSLAAELHLKSQGAAEVVGVGFHTRASLAQLDLLEVGSKTMANPAVVLHNLDDFKEAGLHIRGILGGNFLRRFDVLIDYGHSMLCLDDTNVMRPEVKGEQIALVTPPQKSDDTTDHVIIAVHLSGTGTRPLLLKIDSGTNVPFLYDPAKYLAPALSANAPLRGRSADGVERTFTVLPPQNMQIGTLTYHQISFVTLAGRGNASRVELDGLLPTGLFRRVFISYADHFIVLVPW
jgi:hypothetical protein